MSKQASPAVIGAFVVGAISLVCIAILIFSSFQFMTPKDRFVVFFEGSVNGLKVGAPVKLKGVQVGHVTDIQVHFNMDKTEVRTPVYLLVDLSQVNFETSESRDISFDLTYESLIRHGLRAQLKSQSLLTGQLYVEVNFYPKTKINLVGGDVNLREIPALASDTDEIISNVKSLPLNELVNSLLDTSKDIQRLVNSPDILNSARKLEQILDTLDRVVGRLDKRVDPLVSSIEATMKDTRRLINNVNGQIGPVAKNTQEVLEQVQRSLMTLEEATSSDSPAYNDLTNTLNELTEAARSIRVLAEYLKRNPEALLYGKRDAGGD